MSNNPEQFKQTQENNLEVSKSAADQLEKINNNLEKSVESSLKNNEAKAEIAKQKALESAVSVERGSTEKKKFNSDKKVFKRGRVNKKLRDESYARTLKQVQNELPATNRTFSKIIHNKVIEKTSDIVGNTVARPNAMLYGAFFAFILTLAVYITAKTIGYRLSGFETILAFIIGWLFGVVCDYLHALFTGK